MLQTALIAVMLPVLSGCITPAPPDNAPRTARSASARADFVRASPCPSTGERRGACPGWVVDHVVPLCAGGADHPRNMQWQTVADARKKDIEERKRCAALRR